MKAETFISNYDVIFKLIKILPAFFFGVLA